MANFPRRSFLKTAALATLGTGLIHGAQPTWAAAKRSRKFTMSLRCGSIGVKADPLEQIRLAKKYGFEALAPPNMGKLSTGEIGGLVKAMKRAKLVWGAGGLTVDYRKDEDRFLAGMADLPTEAKALQSAGVTRVGTWLTPASNELPYRKNFEQTGRRLREIAKVYGDQGIRFGLEYVGPKTSWSTRKYAFVHNMKQTKELIAAIDCDNVGFILDSWHWYTAHEGVDDLLTLTNADIVACDLNDAPAGLAIDEQKDNTRDLPCATGVIDLKGFLTALVKIGYDGPVRAEPFLKSLSAMDDEPAVVETAAAMKKAFGLIE